MAKMSKCLSGLEASILDQDRWIHFVEEHLSIIKEKASVVEVKKDEAWRFRGDLYGYLFEKGEMYAYHYPIMRLMGWVRPSQFDEHVTYLLKPAQSTIEELASDFVNEHRY